MNATPAENAKNSSETVLVTGAGGMLGTAVRGILPGAVFVTRKDCDLTLLPDVRSLFDRVRPTAVLHLAAQVGGVKWNAEKNVEMFSSNTLINTNVLSVAADHGVKRLVACVSGCAFPENPDGRRMTEDDLHNGPPYAGHLGFASAKRMADRQVQLVRSQMGFDWTALIPASMYGPNDNFDLANGHVVAGLIRKIASAKTGTPLEIWGGGEAVRQFVYARDIARVLQEVLRHTSPPGRLYVAANEGITIRTLAEEVAGAMGFTGKVVFLSEKPEGEKIRTVSPLRFRKFFPSFPFTELSRGLRETADWFRKQTVFRGRD